MGNLGELEKLANSAKDIKEHIEITEKNYTLTESEMEQFIRYIRGEIVTAPDVVAKMNSNIKSKLIAGQSYYIFDQMSKIPMLLNFMKLAEDKIYDTNSINNLSTEDLIKRYEKAQDSIVSIMEYGRRFYTANKGNWKEMEEKQDIAKQLLGGFTEDKLDMLIDLISTGKLDRLLSEG